MSEEGFEHYLRASALYVEDRNKRIVVITVEKVLLLLT